MKKYKLKNLVVLTIQNREKHIHNQTKIICEERWDFFKEEICWVEIFTGVKFTKEIKAKEGFIVEEFSQYFPKLIENCEDYKFSKSELLPYYDELNKIELLRNIDEDDIENYLNSKNKFKNSKTYIKKM